MSNWFSINGKLIHIRRAQPCRWRREDAHYVLSSALKLNKLLLHPTQLFQVDRGNVLGQHLQYIGHPLGNTQQLSIQTPCKIAERLMCVVQCD